MIALRLALFLVGVIAFAIAYDRLLRVVARLVRGAPRLDPEAIDRDIRRMTKSDRRAVRRAIDDIYAHARLRSPPPSHQVFVDSPLTAAIAFGLADGVWWLRAHRSEHSTIFGRPIEDDELGHAMDQACERAVMAGSVALFGVVPKQVDRLVAAALTAARQAALPGSGTELPPDGARVLCHAARSMRIGVARRVIGTGSVAQDVVRFPLFREIDVAIDRIVRAAPETTGDVAGFLLDRLPLWWRPRGPIREDLADLVRLAADVNGSLWLRVPGWRSLATLAARSGPHFLHPAFWIVSDRPCGLYRDEQMRAHRDQGVAIGWRDGWGLPYLYGIPVALRHVNGVPSLDEIRAERNAEVRRVLIQRYERGDRYRYFADAGAQVLDQDHDGCGLPRRLLRIRYGDDDEPWVALELTNTTPEPDGSRRRYLLRVPPGMRTCRDAVAWTFGLSADAYEPDDES